MLTAILIPIILVLVFLFSVIGTWVVLHCAKCYGWFSIPNERSSHTIPTPNGGGIAIAIAFFISLIVFNFFHVIEKNLMWAFIGGGILITIIGWVDDRYIVRVPIRILVHAVAAVVAIWFLGGGPTSLSIGSAHLSLGIWGSIFGVIGIVWASNFYNFMDGIDGLAASEAVMIGGVVGAILFLTGASGLAVITWSLAASAGGFLIWNWHPAKIFMGDTGSVLLGFSFAVLALASEKTAEIPLLLWVMVLGVCVVDATATTLRRISHGERWFEAHRTFAYQRAVAHGFRHNKVVIGILGLNILLLLFAIIASQEPRAMLPLFLMSIFILFWIWRGIQHDFHFSFKKYPPQ